MSGAGRRWLELSVRCPPGDDRADLLVEGLLGLGGRAAEERDGWLVTHLAAPSGLVTVADLDAFMATAAGTLRAVTGFEALEVRADWREHQEWSETWKRGLAPRQITERILVRPSWLASPAEATGVTIVLDPGMAFGTAEHGTTRGSLRLLDGALRAGDRVLDVGAGSGILAIAAALLGAAEVVAIEADELSCEALRENVEHNRVQERVRCVEGRVDTPGLVALGPASGIVANIETGVLTELMAGFAGALAPGGWLILSGILEHEWPGMRVRAERVGFRFVALDADGEWCSGRFESV